MKPDLKTAQEAFWSLTQAPLGVAERWREAQATSFLAPGELIAERRPGEAMERMEIYAQMYFWRIWDSLREDFPATEAVLGEEAFHGLAVDFVRARPSCHPDLALLSREFPPYVAGHPCAEVRPYLADLSLLEWTGIEVEREADAASLTPVALKSLAPERWGRLRLQLLPSVRLLRTSYAVLEPWRLLGGGARRAGRVEWRLEPQLLLVWRGEAGLRCEAVTEEEARWLSLLARGLFLEDLCEALARNSARDPVAAAAGYLQGWLEKGILRRPPLPGDLSAGSNPL